MNPLYFIRLDDACPTNNLNKWNAVESFLDRVNIRPIVCVIPDNQDPNLVKGEYDHHFWQRVQTWQNKGWHIALHGYSHVYTTRKGGLIPINRYSEFAGVEKAVQKKKIRDGMAILHSHGIKPSVWVAPAHTFDRNTLDVLYEETDIRIVSDGIAYYPFSRLRFFWLPQQLWHFKLQRHGIWTMCYHLDISPDSFIEEQCCLIEKHADLFRVSLTDIQNAYIDRTRDFKDFLFEKKFHFKNRLKRLLKKK